MSLKRMFTKLALAYAATQGVKAFRRSGGLSGLQDKVRRHGGIEGLLRQGGLAGALGGLTGGAMAGAAGTRDSHDRYANEDLGHVIGATAGSRPGASGAKVEGLLSRTRRDEAGEERAAGFAIRAMIQAARADGEIDDQEHAMLTEVLGESAPEDQRFVDQALAEPVDGAALAAEVPEGDELEVYSAALMAIDPDNRAEAEYLHALASGMNLGQDRVNEIHGAMGKPALY